jgi:hypothetical protein
MPLRNWMWIWYQYGDCSSHNAVVEPRILKRVHPGCLTDWGGPRQCTWKSTPWLFDCGGPRTWPHTIWFFVIWKLWRAFCANMFQHTKPYSTACYWWLLPCHFIDFNISLIKNVLNVLYMVLCHPWNRKIFFWNFYFVLSWIKYYFICLG